MTHTPHHLHRAVRPATPVARRAGFSLIEILVVVAIVAALIGIGAFAFSGFQSSSRIQTTRGILQHAQSAAEEYKATAGRKINPVKNDPVDWTTAKAENADEPYSGSPPTSVISDPNASIERFVWEVRQMQESEKILRGLGDHLRDTDGDGFLEIIDSWEQPVKYFKSSDETDAGEGVPPHPEPFFASAGPDGKWGTFSGSKANNDGAEDNIFSFYLD